MYKKRSRENPGIFSFDELAFEIGFFGSGGFLSGLFGHFLSLFTLAFALALVALAVAAIAIVALALAGALAIDVALAAFALIAAALAQQILCPGNDLVAVSGNNINDTGNSGQSGQNLQNDRQNLHNITSCLNKYSTY
jgi:hypothetical protein